MSSGVLLIRLDDDQLDDLARRIASCLSASVETKPERWLGTHSAAEYLGIHPDTLRKLAARKQIPCEQQGPMCRRYFKTTDLETWRLSSGTLP